MTKTWIRSSRPQHGRLSGAILLAASLLLGACGGGSGDNGGSSTTGGLPAQIKVMTIEPETGPVAAPGLATEKGFEVALAEITSQKYLGNTKIALDKKDTAGSPQTAASHLTSAISDGGYAAVLGSLSSDQAVVEAPIAEKGKMPIIFTQAGSNGVVIGKYTFRMTPPMSVYYPHLNDYIKAKKWKTIGIVYAAWVPTYKDLVEQTFPTMAKEDGFKIVASIGTQLTTQDYTAPIAQALAAKPDGMAILQIGTSNPTAMTQLRQAGYTGSVLGSSGAGFGILKPAGAAAAGMVWSVDYSPLNKTAASEKFVKLYQAKNPGELPPNYAAEAYDSLWMLARALKQANSIDHDAIQQALAKVAASGFTGAMGDLKFEGNDLRLPGVLIQWDGTQEVLVTP